LLLNSEIASEMKPPFTEQIQKYGCFQNFPKGKISVINCPVSAEALVTKEC
jgi:hypothetical protein